MTNWFLTWLQDLIHYVLWIYWPISDFQISLKNSLNSDDFAYNNIKETFYINKKETVWIK